MKYPSLLILSLIALFTTPISHASPIKFVDEVGRQVAFPFPPKRIISLAPNITEILFSLGHKKNTARKELDNSLL